MPLRLIITQKNRIAQYLIDDLSVAAIIEIEHVSERSITRIRANLRTFDEHSRLRFSALERSRALTSSMKTALQIFLKTKS